MTIALVGLPPGYAARRPTMDDVDALLTVVHAAERVVTGRDDSTLAEVRDLLSVPRTPPETDHWVVERGNAVAAWGMVIDDYGGERLDLDAYQDPAHPAEIREVLLAVLLGRVRDHAASRDTREVVVSVGVIVGDESAESAVHARGFVAERRFNRLRIELGADRPFPTPPTGVAVEPFDGSDDHWAAWHALLEDSFADHWGYERTQLDAFRQSIDAEEDPELDRWRFAVVDGTRAGICQASGRYADEKGGWIRNLGVVTWARGRGAGRYLLERAFASFAADGRTWAGLDVDTENVSGALRLYESAGMRPSMQIDAYRRRIRAAP